MPLVSFKKKRDARTGNILFQYLMCKVLCLRFGHHYIPIEEFRETENILTITDENARRILERPPLDIAESNIVCDGFFQQSDFYVPHREVLLQQFYDPAHTDYWIGYGGHRQTIRDFITCQHKQTDLSPEDIVISLRLDDFIQLPCPTSDIIPPQYYLNLIENHGWFRRLYIVCDTIRHDWERKYLEFFGKWEPILLQENMMHDCAIMRDCPVLLHSNSTLCWFMSFLSRSKSKRCIPKTNFYGGQCLKTIEVGDHLQDVSPLSHHAVYHLNHQAFLKQNIYSIPYSIPDDYIVGDEVVQKKHVVIADLIPGELITYRFDGDQEEEYKQMYQESLFAYTRRKEGWDCLRHYEIMANGCIPIFRDLDQCPPETMVSFPKEMVKEANRVLLPWKWSKKPMYDSYARMMLEWVRNHCSTSATTRNFLKKMGEINPAKKEIRNVLLITGNIGVNYTRETFWIGMKQHLQSIGGIGVEIPKIDFMYDTYSGDKKGLYGRGFTYPCRLKDDVQMTEKDVVEKIKSRFWDLIIYGKVGPDETPFGNLPNMPYWSDVFKRYSKHEIVFLYGGDGIQDMTHPNRYSNHLWYQSQFAHCFVRELRF
jgi:hypothetical protein